MKTATYSQYDCLKMEGEAYQKEQEFLTQKNISGLKGDTVKNDRNLLAYFKKLLYLTKLLLKVKKKSFGIEFAL